MKKIIFIFSSLFFTPVFSVNASIQECQTYYLEFEDQYHSKEYVGVDSAVINQFKNSLRMEVCFLEMGYQNLGEVRFDKGNGYGGPYTIISSKVGEMKITDYSGVLGPYSIRVSDNNITVLQLANGVLIDTFKKISRSSYLQIKEEKRSRDLEEKRLEEEKINELKSQIETKVIEFLNDDRLADIIKYLKEIGQKYSVEPLLKPELKTKIIDKIFVNPIKVVLKKEIVNNYLKSTILSDGWFSKSLNTTVDDIYLSGDLLKSKTLGDTFQIEVEIENLISDSDIVKLELLKIIGIDSENYIVISPIEINIEVEKIIHKEFILFGGGNKSRKLFLNKDNFKTFSDNLLNGDECQNKECDDYIFSLKADKTYNTSLSTSTFKIMKNELEDLFNMYNNPKVFQYIEAKTPSDNGGWVLRNDFALHETFKNYVGNDITEAFNKTLVSGQLGNIFFFSTYKDRLNIFSVLEYKLKINGVNVNEIFPLTYSNNSDQDLKFNEKFMTIQYHNVKN